MEILLGIKVAVVVVLFFGASIFVHEWGHYYAARRRGMKVEAFAIGFGPKIFSWVKDGIEYSVRWIPAGGFVKLPQMHTSDAIEGQAASTEPIPPASPLSKIIVAVAGPVMNVVFAFAVATVIYFVGLPVLVNPPIIGYVDPKSEEAALGIKEGDKVVEIDGQKVKSWQDVIFIPVLSRSPQMAVVIERDGVKKTYDLTAKVSAANGWKLLNLEPKDHPEIQQVLDGQPAKEAGLKERDIVLAFGGVPVASDRQLIDLIHKRADQKTEMTLQRGGEKLTVEITPKADPGSKEGRIGVMLSNSSTSVYVVQRPGPKPWDQVHDVWDKTIKTLSALIHTRETGVGAKDLSGPVGILAILASQVNTDYRLALSFLVLLNINLAILNMLPLPVLDGGHIVMSLIESITRRPLSPKFVEYATMGFAVLLISFMLYVTTYDLRRLPQFKALFKSETQIQEPDQTPAKTEPAK
ncbi:MAG: RIP metalloprotease RseP [Verrucomicrobiota bacterium]